MNDPETTKYINLLYPISEASTTNWLNNLIKDKSRLDFIICLKENEAPIGYTGFRNIDHLNRKAESYTAICEKEFLKNNYASEAKILALKHVFTTFNLNLVYAKIRKDNKSAIALNRSIGYQVDGTLRCHIYSKGAFRDMLIMSILKKEFLALHSQG